MPTTHSAITGALETFRGTGELPYYLIASNFWEIVNGSAMYSIGGVAGAQKRFGNAGMNGFTCGNGTAVEGHSKLQDSIYLLNWVGRKEASSRSRISRTPTELGSS
jgi:hypothetical protein